MSLIELVRIVFGNLRRMIFRVMLTAAGVMIGTFAVILLVSIGNGLQQIATQGLGGVGELSQIQVYNYSFDQSSANDPITERVISDWRNLTGVIAATPIVELTFNVERRLVLNRDSAYANIVGVDASQIENLGFEMAHGTKRLSDGQILIGSRIENEFFNERTGRPVEDLDLQGKTIQLLLTRYNSDGSPTERRVRLRVAGVIAETGGQIDSQIYMTLKDVHSHNEWATGDRFNERRDGYSQVLIQAERPDLVEGIEEVVSSQGFQTFSLQQILRESRIVFGTIQAAFGCIGSIALIVAAIGIANTMIMAIYERTREIGLMKAVGATNRDVMLIFLGEAGTIGLIGGTMGVVFALIVGEVGGLIAVDLMQSQLGAPPDVESPINTPMWLVMFAITFSTLIGIISGIYPAIRAVQLDPMIALKYE